MSDIISIREENPQFNLRTNLSDILAQSLKGVAGLAAIPLLGPIAELLTSYIPGQKLDRVIDFVEILNDKLTQIENKPLPNLEKEQIADLVEDAVLQASKALTRSRRSLIASGLIKSLTLDEIQYENKKRLMEVLDQLNNVEIILLMGSSLWPTEEEEFYDFHENLWKSAEADFGASTLEFSGETMLAEYRENLMRLNLTQEDRQLSRFGELLLTFLGLNRESRNPGEFEGQWADLMNDK